MAQPYHTFDECLRAAIADFVDHGFDSQERLDFWLNELKIHAERFLANKVQRENALAMAFEAIYRRLISSRGILRYHPGVSAMTLQHVAPLFRAELERRIMVSADMIRVNRAQAISDTLERFRGWASSIPDGGTRAEDKRETRVKLAKNFNQLSYRERFVANDQGHKFAAALNQTLADQNGAIALRWASRWRALNYHYRPDHKERDGQVYLMRNSWAQRQGLVKPGEAGYYDEVTAVGQEPNCRCSAVFIYALSRLPEDMLTQKGKAKLEQAREKLYAA
jgi:hypothetical protein